MCLRDRSVQADSRWYPDRQLEFPCQNCARHSTNLEKLTEIRLKRGGHVVAQPTGGDIFQGSYDVLAPNLIRMLVRMLTCEYNG